jgi:DNA-binding MarR family transcriptional regulator
MPTTEEKKNESQRDVERLAEILMSLQRCFILQLSEELGRGQVSFAQFFLLGHIATHESLSMSEVAEKMNHSTAAATGLVDRLENLGYVQRGHAPNDRRKVLVRITKKGSSLVEKMRQNFITNLSAVRELLSPEEQKAWLCIYEKIHSFCQSKQQQGQCKK